MSVKWNRKLLYFHITFAGCVWFFSPSVLPTIFIHSHPCRASESLMKASNTEQTALYYTHSLSYIKFWIFAYFCWSLYLKLETCLLFSLSTVYRELFVFPLLWITFIKKYFTCTSNAANASLWLSAPQWENMYLLVFYPGRQAAPSHCVWILLMCYASTFLGPLMWWM